MRISPTRLKTYLTCPRQYRYVYIDKIEVPLSSSLAFGRAVHEALHLLYLDGDGQVATDPAPAIATFDRLWQEALERDNPTFTSSSPTPEGYRELAHRMLTGFIAGQSDKPFPLVMEFPFEVEASEHTLVGIIDRVDAGGDGLTIVDYKTGRAKPSRRDVDGDLQLTVYALAAEQVFGMPVERIVYYHLRDQTEIVTTRGTEEFERLTSLVLPHVLQAIEAAMFPPCYGYWCRYCDHRERCQAEGPA